MRNRMTRWVCVGHLLFFSLSAQFSLAAPGGPKPIKVKPENLFTLPGEDGEPITCAQVKGRYISGRSRSSNKFWPDSNELKALKAKVAKASGAKKKKLAKKLKARKAEFSSAAAVCAQGPDPLYARKGPLTEADVRFLYEKAALGAPPAEAIAIGTTQGAGALVDYLMQYRPNAALEEEAAKYLDENYTDDTGSVTARGVHLWALHLLIESDNPFHERLAFLFLHNLLATSMEALTFDSQLPLMLDHMNKLRARAIEGGYRTLLKEITRDPVMLIWLNGNQNTRQQPNENFARELMELFTISPSDASGQPNYSEQTVAQVARACTGWTVQELDVGNDQFLWSAVFGSAIHDPDPNKIVFESRPYQAAVENDFDVIDHILDNHPNAPLYLAGRILEEYLREDAPEAIRASLAATLKQNDYNLLPALAKLLKSAEFYDPANRNTIIKSPTERVVSLIRSLDFPHDLERLQRAMEGAGQQIGMPPTVFGWNNRDWANGQWLLNISNAVTQMMRNDSLFNSPEVAFTYSKLLPHPAATGQEAIAHLEKLMGITLTPEQRASVALYMNNRRNSQGVIVAEAWDPTNAARVRRKVAGLIEILFRTNDFQLR